MFSAKDGRQIEIRPAVIEDAESIISFAKILFPSTDQVLTLPEEYKMTVAEELLFIESYSSTPTALLLVAVYGNEVVSLLNFKCGEKKKVRHSGEFGISVHPAFQGLGIGKQMIIELLNWAKQKPQIEKIFLNVFHTNPVAINLYKSLGFKEEGRMLKAAKQPDNTYADMIYMSKFMNE